jgi:ADP-dependent NAD(P)H-hydrate dehydratase / NAD(P)H-hydrate epimerase
VIPLVTAADVKRAEADAIEAGTTEAELMLSAGTQIADLIDLERIGPGNALVLCGPGNNGGDGVVIAARLRDLGWNVTTWTWKRDRAGAAPISEEQGNALTWISKPGDVAEYLQKADVVIDAVFGAGSRAELPDEVVEVFDIIRESRDDRYFDTWAVDLPSGASSDTGEVAEQSLHADVTAFIGLPKVGLYRLPAASRTGRLVGIDIGLRASADLDGAHPELITAGRVRELIPQRRTGVHKRSAGTVLVVGGAPNYYGAPRMSAESALRSGSGLVSVAAPASIIAPIATAVPELTFVPLPVAEHATAAARMAKIVREKMAAADALVIGPGLGTDAPVPEFLSQLLGFVQPGRTGIGFGSHNEPEQVYPFSGRAVFDADALNWLAETDEWASTLKDASLVLTPHAGELARLLDCEREEVESDPWRKAQEAAALFSQVVVLKHAHSIVATPTGKLYIADQAPPGLATAGTGDVLAGCIGAFLAQGLDPESAAMAGVALGLRAAEIAATEIGTVGYTATDVIERLPAARDVIIRSRSRFD